MKIPSSILLGGVRYAIKRSKIGGGHFSGNKQVIEIGIDHTPQMVKQIFLHEIIEVIMAERNMRFAKENNPKQNGDYLFCFDHEQFEQFIKDLSIALDGLL